MLRKILAHGNIVLAGMFIVFFILDQYNPAMNFIGNTISKRLLLLLCVLALAQSVIGLIAMRRSERWFHERGRGNPGER